MKTDVETHEQTKIYYGETLQGTDDLKSDVCCSTDQSWPHGAKEALALIDDEIMKRFYGCGSPIPPLLDGCTVVDLGCGTGRDVYVASKLVGESGFVTGIDMTDEQLAVATKHIQSQMDKFGFSKPNVDFRKGYIEDLKVLGVADNSVDVVISNCVINLSPNKETVFREIFRVLKPGGELYFSDVFADRRIPEALAEDPVLHGECLSGAMYIEDFRRMMATVGCPDYRVAKKGRITLGSPQLEEKIGMINFYSMNIRAFKLEDMEDLCEDYGQVAAYKGTIPGHPHFFDLDDHHRLFTGRPMPVCGNTGSMLANTRYGSHFEVSGDRSVHHGLFGCGSKDRAIGEDDGRVACC